MAPELGETLQRVIEKARSIGLRRFEESEPAFVSREIIPGIADLIVDGVDFFSRVLDHYGGGHRPSRSSAESAGWLCARLASQPDAEVRRPIYFHARGGSPLSPGLKGRSSRSVLMAYHGCCNYRNSLDTLVDRS